MRVLHPDAESIAQAAQLLSRGELVAFPTETVYGLGANAWDEQAVARIFEAKGRPPTNPLIVHLRSRGQLEQAVALPLRASITAALERLADLWPGPLTLVLPCGPRIVPAVTAGRATVAVRVPDHPVAQRLLDACPFPIAAPSANPSNYVSPTTAEHVAAEFGENVQLVLDGGPCAAGIESTIVSLVDEPPRILRLGSITAEQLAQRLDLPLEVLLRESPEPPGAHPAGEASPGRLPEHYAPRTPLVFLQDVPADADLSRAGLITLTAAAPPSGYAQVAVLSPRGSLAEAAQRLFAVLREMDRAGLELIVVEPCDEIGIGRAIMDRLRRATARGRAARASQNR